MKGFSSNTLTHYTITFMGIVTSILIARMIGPEGRGIYAKIILITLLLNEFISIGFYKSLTYHSAKQPNYSRNYYNYFLKICLPLSIIVCLVSFFLYEKIFDNSTEVFYFRLALIYIIFYVLFHSTSHILHGLNEFKIWNIFRFLQTFVWMAIIVLSYYFFPEQFNFKILIIIFIINHIIFSTIYFLIYNDKAPKLKSNFDDNHKKSFFNYNIKNFFLKLSEKFFHEFDLILVIFLFDDIITGIYAVSKSIALLSIPLFSSFSEKAFQSMSLKFKFKDLTKNLKILIILSLLGYIFFYFIGQKIIIILYGESFKEVYKITLYLLINYIFTGFIIYSLDIFRSQKIFFKPAIVILVMIISILLFLIYFNVTDLFLIIKILIMSNLIVIFTFLLLFYYEKNKNFNRFS